MNLANLRKRRTRNPFERINPIPPREMNSLSFSIFLSQKLVKCVLHAPLFLSRRSFGPRGNHRLDHRSSPFFQGKRTAAAFLISIIDTLRYFFFKQNIHQISQLLLNVYPCDYGCLAKVSQRVQKFLTNILRALRKTFGNLMLQRDTAIELIMLMKRMCEYYNEMYRMNEIF